MIAWIIDWSLRNRLLVGALAVLLAALGLRALRETPVDAIPDLSENQVVVFADWAGRSPQEVEDQVTYPLSTSLQGLGGVKAVRANSMFGFSLVTVVFRDDVPAAAARQRVLERLSFAGGSLPAGVTPRLGPDATGLGWIFQYQLRVDPARASAATDLGALRSLQDWFLRPQLASVPGVAEVAGVGGFARQWQVEVSSRKMQSLQIPLAAVLDAVARANLAVGGKAIEENGQEFIVRGNGLLASPRELEEIVLAERNGTPIYLREVARVEVGGEFRRGALVDAAGREVVGGIVVMRTGENTRAVLAAVKEKFAVLAPSLPAGVTVEAFYDRSGLIDRTVGTLRFALLEAIVLVTVAHVVFLWHFRSVVIVTLPLPLSILGAFLLMRLGDIGSNLMSLCGLAIAIGVLVDAAIVLTENVIRHAEEAEAGGARLSPADYLRITRDASRQVGRPIFFAMAIILLAFLPIFALGGREGKLFHPLAFTKTFAMAVSTLLAVTLVPVLCSILVRGPFHREKDNVVMRALLRLYRPALDWALRSRALVLTLAGGLLAAAAILWLGLPRAVVAKLDGWPRVQRVAAGFGEEFMPALDEGSFLFMPVLAPSTSLPEIARVMAWQNQRLRATPEVSDVVGKLGRADTPTDPAPTEMIETTITLRPRSEWRPGLTKAALLAELQGKVTLAGYAPGFLQPIENRILMVATGIRAQLGVKLLGDDLAVLQREAFRVQKVVAAVSGATGVSPSLAQAKPYLEIRPRDRDLARWGLSRRDLMDAVETGLGGTVVSTAIRGRERIPIQVRLERGDRDDFARVGDLLVSAAGSAAPRFVPLAQVADVVRVVGPNEIASENGRLRAFVQANAEGRDLAGFVEEVRARIAREILPTLPPGVTVEYSGEYESILSSSRTLAFAGPAAIAIIFVLLYMVYRSAREAAHVLLAVPFALTGGVFLQAILGIPLSAAVKAGYIALFGTAIQTGVVMVVYLEEAVAKRRRERGPAFDAADLLAAVREGALLRLRPKVMTVATVLASLLPLMWSTRTGAEVLRPLAAPVIGGMASSLVHILLVTPVIFYWLRSREFGAKRDASPGYRVDEVEGEESRIVEVA